MKKQKLVKMAAVLTMATGIVTLIMAKEEKDATMSFAQVPALVQATIQANIGTNNIKRIMMEDHDGKPAYEIETSKVDLIVAEDGKLLSKEIKITLADVPEAARKTLAEQTGKGKVEKVEQIIENGKTVYEADVEKDAKDFEITVSPDGKLIKSEEIKEEKD